MSVLIKYVRSKDKTPVGVVCAIDKCKIGWSKCNIKAGDKFNKKIGRKIAIGRAKKSNNNHPKVLDGINFEQPIDEMIKRSKKYFKVR